MTLSSNVKNPDFHELDPFIYVAGEYEEAPAEIRKEFEEGVFDEAKRWTAASRCRSQVSDR